jgi:hypothetical protein
MLIHSPGLPDEHLVVGGIGGISTEVFTGKLEEASTWQQGVGVGLRVFYR